MNVSKYLGIVIAAGIAATGLSSNAAVIHDSSTTVYTNGYVAGHVDATSVGQNGNGKYEARAYVLFSVDDILADAGLTLGTLASTTFDVSFITVVDAIALPNVSTYKVEYLGFYENADATATVDLTTTGNESNSGGAFWNSVLNGASGPVIDSGIADNASLGQVITASGFTLLGATVADSDDDYVAFRISYAAQPTSIQQQLDEFTISTVSVPEPASLAVGLVALTLIAARRRR